MRYDLNNLERYKQLVGPREGLLSGGLRALHPFSSLRGRQARPSFSHQAQDRLAAGRACRKEEYTLQGGGGRLVLRRGLGLQRSLGGTQRSIRAGLEALARVVAQGRRDRLPL